MAGSTVTATPAPASRLRDLDLSLGRDGGELGGVTDGDAAAVAVGVGRAAHFVQMHPAGIEIEVEVEVDVEVEAAGDGEDARDVLVGVRVGVGAAADQIGAPGAGRHQQLLRARVVDQPLLREDADLQVERPGVLSLQLRHGLEAAQANARVDLDVGAHVHGAVEDRLLQRAAGAGDDVILGEGPLCARGLGDGFLQRAGDDSAAVGDARLVEMDVGFDEARRHEAAFETLIGTSCREIGLDRGDAAVANADVDEPVFSAGDAGGAQDEIERHRPHSAASRPPR